MRQFVLLLALGFRSSFARLRSCSVIIIGVGTVTIVLCFFGAMTAGLESAFEASGRADRAVILRQGSDTEITSRLPRKFEDTLRAAPAIGKSEPDGPAISAELLRILNLKDERGVTLTFQIRGIGQGATLVRPEFQIVAGRSFRPGTQEIVVGKTLLDTNRLFRVGSKISIKRTDWIITGVFTSGGSLHESQLLTDVDALLSLYGSDQVSSFTVRLRTPEAIAELRSFVADVPGSRVDIINEESYYQRQTGEASALLRAMAQVVGIFMVIAALFASMTAVNTSLQARWTEVATLRALGYANTHMIAAISIETLAFAIVGAIIGGVVAILFFSGISVMTLTGSELESQTAFQLTVTGKTLLSSALWAVIVGVLGGLIPAVGVVRVSVVDALKQA